MKDSGVIIETTTNSEEIAASITKNLLESRKAACVHISTIESHYWWNGQIAQHKELKLSIKTLKSKAYEAIVAIKSLHNYSVPEIIQINIDESSTEYISWLAKETKQPIAH